MTKEVLSIGVILLSGAVAAVACIDMMQYRKFRKAYVDAGILQGGK